MQVDISEMQWFPRRFGMWGHLWRYETYQFGWSKTKVFFSWPWGGIATTMYRIDDIEIAERPRGLNGLMICALRNYLPMVRCWPWGGTLNTNEKVVT